MDSIVETSKTFLNDIFHSKWFQLTAGSILVFKIWMKITTGRCKCKADLTDKTVIVTGANSGIGLEAAKDFAQRGARVIMVCRDVIKAFKVRTDIIAETGNKNIDIKHVDFASLALVRKCASEILENEAQIHVLLNNAGIITGRCETTADGLNMIMQTNHFGPFLFTNILLDRIRASEPSRIINVSSEWHKGANLDLQRLDSSHASNDTIAYANTKLCNILMSNELADRLSETGVTVNSVTPGVVHTDILRDAPGWHRKSWNAIAKLLLKSPREGAQTLIHVSVSPYLNEVSGEYFKDCKVASVSNRALDKSQAELLWDLSEKAVNLQESERHTQKSTNTSFDRTPDRLTRNRQHGNKCYP